MDRKITIEICVGTSCHLMGSNLIIDYLNNLPEKMKEKIELKHISCMDECEKGPRVRVGDQVISFATPEKVQKALQQKIFS